MHEKALTLLVLSLCGLTLAAWLLPPLAGTLRKTWRQYAARVKSEAAVIAVFFLCAVYVGGTKPTNSAPQGGDSEFMFEPAELDGLLGEGGESEPSRLSTNQYAAGFALLPQAVTNTAWLAVPSNAVTHAPWTRYGLAEDTFWLPATNWGFVLGTNAVEGAHVSSSGTLSFDPTTPKGSPRAVAMPDGDAFSFLAPLQASLGTVPPQGRFWHAVTPSNSVLMTWQDLYAGRDTNSPVTFQTELFGNGDFTYRYAFTNALALTNLVIGAQHNGGGETCALDATNRLANGLELRWRAFGMLDPGVDDHDADGVSTYVEVMTHESDPTMPDTDLDGLGDAEEDPVGGPHPRVRDSDNDGLVDGSDPDPVNAGSAADLDGDGLPDAWENYRFGSTNATDSADADTNGDGFSDRANLLTGANPVFAACAVTASGGSHTFTWTVLPDATNYAATVTRGGAAVWSCVTNVCLLSVTGDYSSAVHTLTVTSHGGAASRTASVSFRQPSQPNLTVWKIADPFALELPQGCTNVLERSFRINRSNAWQQYFISSGRDAAGAWALDGLRLDWSDNGGGSDSAAASPAGDSLRLAVSTNGPQSLTVRLVPEGAGGLVRSPKPLYLLGWSPAVTFSSSGTVSVASTNGNVLVAVSDRSGGATAVSFTVDRGGRPGNAAPGADEIAQQSAPFGLDSGAPFAGTQGVDGALTGGTVIAGDPGEFRLFDLPDGEGGGSGGGGSSQPPPPPPAPGTAAPPPALCLISPAVSQTGGARHCGCDYGGSDAYPFDSVCLREAWRNAGGCWEEEPAGFSVTLGSEALDALFTVKINGAATRHHEWSDGVRTAQAAAELAGTAVWNKVVTREPAIPEGFCDYLWDDGECGSCGGCESGDCSSAEGERPGSVRFRIPLGFTGTKRLAGFVWFRLETPQAITPATFHLAAADGLVNVVSNNPGGELRSAVCNDPGGRDILIEPATGGVRVSVRDTGDTVEDRAWLITTNASGGVNFEKTDSAANTVLDVSYHFDSESARWTRTDNVTRATHSLTRDGDVTNSVEHTLSITSDGDSLVLAGSSSQRKLIGAGTAAVVREIRRSEWDGAAQVWRETHMTWWADSLNPLLNGRPKFRYADGGAWDYRAHDARGRETLRAEPLDGSAHPFFKDEAEPFAFSPAASYGSLTGLVTVTSYAPAQGDGDALNDSRKPREVSVYAVRGGVPALISREWRVYSRDTNAVWQTVTQRVTRAASPAAGADDAANARSLTVAYADDDDAVPALLRGRPLREEREDGTLLTWAYALDAATLTVTSRRGTTAHPEGLANVSTYEVETFDAVFGRSLGRETRLYTGAAGGALLASETRAYDGNGRLLATAYSDGTSESNLWDCCRLQAKVGRDGSRTDYLAIPGDGHWSAVEETSLGALPGAGGSYPAVETFTDAIGRETNSVRVVMFNGSRDAAYTPLVTSNEYPFGTGGYRVTTDPLGVRTVTRAYTEGNAKVSETVSAGVTNRTIQVRGGAVIAEQYWDGKWTRETRSTAYDAAGCRVETVTAEASDCPVFAKSVTTCDFLGREVSVAAPLGVTSNFYDGATDRVVRSSRSGQPDTLYVYDALGNVTATAQDVDGDAAITAADRVSASGTHYVEDASNFWWRVTAQAQVCGGVTNSSSQTREQVTGLSDALQSRVVAVDADDVATTETVTFDRSSHIATVTGSSSIRATPSVRLMKYGHLLQTQGLSALSANTYDGLARVAAQSACAADGFTNSVLTVVYDAFGLAVTNRTVYGPDVAVTATAYDNQGRAVSGTDALGNTVSTGYDALSQIASQSGAAYPVEYGYDTQGRKISMKTFRDEYGIGDQTGWLYDGATGLLTNKVYADGSRILYGYTADGRLLSRRWARGAAMTNGYDNLGQITGIDYAGTMFDVFHAYDAFGHAVASSNSFARYEYRSSLSGIATNELVAVGTNICALARSLDANNRPSGLTVDGSETAYGFDAENRLVSVAHPEAEAEYLYTNGLVAGYTLTLTNGNVVGRLVGRDRYRPELVATVSNTFNGARVSEFGYGHDLLGRREKRTDAAAGYSVTNAFGYNQRSEVTNAAFGSDVYAYGYDSIGNHVFHAVNAVTNTYTANALNQYTNLVYDADGNLLSDGRLYHTWDPENRLVRSEPAGMATNGSVRVVNSYDHRHRRIQKRVEVLAGRGAGYPFDPSQPGSWDAVKTHTFVYDGWNLVLETVAHTNGLTDRIEYVWGLDLSGTLQGAGGVGGLLFEKRNGQIFIPLYDANGNVTAYVDAGGNVRAKYVYDAFGCTVAQSQSGDMDDTFAFRFSTKYCDAETELYYYGYRYYVPFLKRWINRDPIGEDGGINPCAFLKNDPLNHIEYLGLTAVSISMQTDIKKDKQGLDKLFLSVKATITEKPPEKCHVNFLQLKKPHNQPWSLDSHSAHNPYYYNYAERIRLTTKTPDGLDVIEFNDRPGGALAGITKFYLLAVEVCRDCCRDNTAFRSVRCKDKVKVLATRFWTYGLSGSFSFRNVDGVQNGDMGKDGLQELLNRLLKDGSWETSPLGFPSTVEGSF